MLHLAGRIRAVVTQRLTNEAWPKTADGAHVIYLVTHSSPDFDALSALFLARRVLEDDALAAPASWLERKLSPDGWVPPVVDEGRIDWRNPAVKMTDHPFRSAILLASYAAHVDQCWPLRCPRPRSLHAVLYAASVRGRNLLHDGAHHLFAAATQRIEHEDLNPLLEPVVAAGQGFDPELDLLALEEARYARDLAKAFIGVVSLPDHDFAHWFLGVNQSPFQANVAKHLDGGMSAPSNAPRRPVDAVFIRDPESLLFKEYARDDRTNSPEGSGFLFTMVAYSGKKATAGLNDIDYYIALDPERAGNLHLYHVWARLEQQEIEQGGDAVLAGLSRVDFAGRQIGSDPWYDGSAFRATIVNPPYKGTWIGRDQRASAPDLSDDEVADLVREQLQFVVFSGQVQWEDFPLTAAAAARPSPGHDDETPLRCTPSEIRSQDIVPDVLRFGRVELKPWTDLSNTRLAQQIGRHIYPLLDPSTRATVPADFVERHLTMGHDYVAVWNRRGMVVAYLERVTERHPDAHGQKIADALGAQVRQLAEVRREMAGLATGRLPARTDWFSRVMTTFEEWLKRVKGEQAAVAGHDIQSSLEAGRDLLRKTAEIKLLAATPDGRPLRHLLNATRFEEVLETLNALNQQVYEDEENRRDFNLQLIFGIGATLAIIVGAFQAFPLITSDSPATWRLGALVAACMAGLIPTILVLGLKRRRASDGRIPARGADGHRDEGPQR